MEDPNLEIEMSEDTGECLLSGIGPLHLDVVVNQLQKRGVQAEISKPQPIFRESVHANTKYVTAKSPNGLNTFKLLLTRISQEDASWFRDPKNVIPKAEADRIKLLTENTSLSELEAKGFWGVTKNNNIIISRRMKIWVFISKKI